MKQRVNGSMSVEAALLYPYLFLIAFLLVKLTIAQYAVVQKQAAELYDAVFTDRQMQTSELLRFTDTAFDFFGK